MGTGAMRERLVIQTNTPTAVVVSSITRVNTTATATTATNHGYATGDYVTIAGADQAAYNGKVQVTVTGVKAFTYVVAGNPATPATGTITVTYEHDAQAGRKAVWSTLDTIWAEPIPIRATERLQARAVQAVTDYRFKVRRRADILATMRALWSPSWGPSTTQYTLEITGVLPWEDGRTWMLLECGKVG